MSNPSSPTKKRGCLFYGCLSLSVVALLIATFIAIGVYFAKKTVDGLVNDYTAVTPEKIEELIYPEPQMRDLQQRLGTFQQSVEKGAGQPVELVLTADDVNAMIAANRDLKGKVFVRIDDDQVKGQISWPLPDLGPLKSKGRFLIGPATFKVSLNNGQLDIRLDQVSVHDKPLPPLILGELKKVDLARETRNNPEASKVIQRLDSLEIREGKVYIRSKPEPGGAAPATETSPVK